MNSSEGGDHVTMTFTLHKIGQGFCGTVWAAAPTGPAFKREDGGPTPLVSSMVVFIDSL
jgi:hypothetical protein